MNIAVINVKDLFKYILKFFLLLLIVIILINMVKSINSIKESINIKEVVETNRINNQSFLGCLDLCIPLISYKKEKRINKNILASNKIISMGSEILDEKILKNNDLVDTDLIVTEEEKVTEKRQELENKIAEIPKEVTMENVTENNIVPKVTNSYNSVKIDNQSDYDITEEMLIPDIEIDNKKDILIYHTHTCESYTPSERI